MFRSTAATVDPSPATKVNTSLVSGTSFADSGLVNGTRYSYVVRAAVDNAGNVGPVSTVTVVTPAAGAAAVSIKVDFADAASAPASGYLLDYGQGFGPRTGANQGTDLAYGWVSPDTSTPVSLVGNGRNRNTASPSANEPDARRATLMHMQYAGTTAGSVARPGSWEVAVPNGLYSVKVDVGDADAVDSSHWVNVENQNAIAAFVPTTTGRYATATRTVAVTDGRITLSPVGGTNTKITYVDIASVAQSGRPYATTVLPLNGTTDVVTNASPTASNELPGGGVNPTTVTGGVTLTRVSDGARVAGEGATSGGADTVSFRPAEGETLLPSTLYRFDVLASVTDASGNHFIPFSSVFTTKADSTNPGTSVAAFDKTDSGASKGNAYTSLTFGPDGRLYAGSIFGQIYRWTVLADGTLTDETVINTVRTHASAAGWEGAPNRTIIGLTFDPASTPENPILWITDNYAYLGSDVPNGTGSIARLSGPNLGTYEEVVVNLPRSIKDHETNSIAFHDGKIYITQGSINAMGAQDGTWEAAREPPLRSGPAARPGQAPEQPAARRVDARPGQGPRQHATARGHLQPVRPRRTAHALRDRHPQRLRPRVAQQRQPLHRHQRLRCGRQHPGHPEPAAGLVRQPSGRRLHGPLGPGPDQQPPGRDRLRLQHQAGQVLRPPEPAALRVRPQRRQSDRLHGQPALQGQRLPGRSAGRPQLRPRQRLRRRTARIGQRHGGVPERGRLRWRAQGQADHGPLQLQPGARDLRRAAPTAACRHRPRASAASPGSPSRST